MSSINSHGCTTSPAESNIEDASDLTTFIELAFHQNQAGGMLLKRISDAVLSDFQHYALMMSQSAVMRKQRFIAQLADERKDLESSLSQMKAQVNQSLLQPKFQGQPHNLKKVSRTECKCGCVRSGEWFQPEQHFITQYDVPYDSTNYKDIRN